MPPKYLANKTLVFQIGRLPPTFNDACKIASAILESGYEFASGKIIYNKFRSVVSYQQSDLPLFSQKAVEVRFLIYIICVFIA